VLAPRLLGLEPHDLNRLAADRFELTSARPDVARVASREIDLVLVRIEELADAG